MVDFTFAVAESGVSVAPGQQVEQKDDELTTASTNHRTVRHGCLTSHTRTHSSLIALSLQVFTVVSPIDAAAACTSADPRAATDQLLRRSHSLTRSHCITTSSSLLPPVACPAAAAVSAEMNVFTNY